MPSSPSVPSCQIRVHSVCRHKVSMSVFFKRKEELCGRGLVSAGQGSYASWLPWLHVIWLLLVPGLRGKLSIPSCFHLPSFLIAWQGGHGTEVGGGNKDEVGCSPPPPQHTLLKKGPVDYRKLFGSKNRRKTPSFASALHSAWYMASSHLL